jgi:hypothetical protein
MAAADGAAPITTATASVTMNEGGTASRRRRRRG